MINPDGLMMIEPLEPSSNEPVKDRYTELAKLATSEMIEKGPMHRFMGAHFCVCGTRSDNGDWQVRGMQTNSLLLHYVRYHRNEVPENELKKLEMFEGVDNKSAKVDKES